MTTLQTLSTRDPLSASSELLRAQTGGLNARTALGGERGFGGVLEAFTNAEPDEAIEQAERVDQVDDSSEGDEQESDEVATDDPDASKDSQLGEGSESSENQQVDGGLSQRISSAGDVTLLLNNAASIDLAGLASGQLGDQVSIQQSIQQSVEQSVEQDGGQQAKSAEQAPVSSRPKQSQNTDARVDHRFVHAASGSIQGGARGDHSQELGSVGVGVKPLEQPIEKQSAQHIPDTQQQSTPAKVQVAQVAQTQVVDHSPTSRRLDGLRSMNEIASVAGRSRTVAGSESSGKAGADQGGLDLGNKSQTAAKLMQTKPSDERAMQRQQVMAQVQRGLASIMNTKGGSMKIRLSPEHLGEVNIQLATKDGHVRVTIDAETDQTRSMLKEGLDGLRSALESRGVQVDDLRIEGRQQTEFERLFGDAGQDQQHQRQNSDRQEHRQAESGGGEVGGELNVDGDDEPRGIWTDLGLDAIA